MILSRNTIVDRRDMEARKKALKTVNLQARKKALKTVNLLKHNNEQV